MGSVRRSVAAAALCLGVLVTAACGPGAAVTDPVASDGDGTVLDDRPGSRESASDGGEAGAGATASDAGGDVVAADAPAPDPKDYPGMDQHTPEGAEQFVRYLAAVRLWSFHTGDTSILRRFFAPSCSVCTEELQRVERAKRADALWPTLRIRPVFSSTERSDARFEIVGFHGYEMPPFERKSEDGSGGKVHSPAEQHIVAAGLRWDEVAWRVENLQIETREAKP